MHIFLTVILKNKYPGFNLEYSVKIDLNNDFSEKSNQNSNLKETNII